MPSEDSKPLRKEEIEHEDNDDKPLGSLFREKSKKKPASASNAAASKLPKSKKEETPRSNSSQKKPVSKPVKVKKFELSESDNDKPIRKKPLAKDDKVKSKKKEEAKEVVVEKKRVKKVFDLPGQKRDPPEEREPLRIFYESLYKQVPDSQMAEIWMMESGLLAKDVAKKVYERKQKKSQMQKLGSPMKPVSTTKRVVQSKSATVKKVTNSSSNSSSKKSKMTVTTVKTKKRRKDESSEDEESEDEESEDEDSGDDFENPKAMKKQKT